MTPTGDAAALAALHAAAFPSPWSEAEFRALLNGPGVVALCEAGAGFILLRTVADEAEILTLAVAPAARRRGLGRRLVEAAAESAAAAGAQRLLLEVAEDNAAALSLYAGCGFGTIGRRPRYYDRGPAPPADALILVRNRPGPLSSP